ncbi:clpB, partial [Symbiodinium sp. CCMP2456]
MMSLTGLMGPIPAPVWQYQHSIVWDDAFVAPFTATWYALQLSTDLSFDAHGFPFTPGCDHRLDHAEEGEELWTPPSSQDEGWNTSRGEVRLCEPAYPLSDFEPYALEYRGDDGDLESLVAAIAGVSGGTCGPSCLHVKHYTIKPRISVVRRCRDALFNEVARLFHRVLSLRETSRLTCKGSPVHSVGACTGPFPGWQAGLLQQPSSAGAGMGVRLVPSGIQGHAEHSRSLQQQPLVARADPSALPTSLPSSSPCADGICRAQAPPLNSTGACTDSFSGWHEGFSQQPYPAGAGMGARLVPSGVQGHAVHSRSLQQQPLVASADLSALPTSLSSSSPCVGGIHRAQAPPLNSTVEVPTGLPQPGRRPSGVRGIIAQRVTITPLSLDRPELRQVPLTTFSWYQGYRATGAVVSSSQYDRYAVFSTSAHAETRRLPGSGSLDEIIEDLVSLHPNLRSVRVLQHRLSGFPAAQVAIATRADPADHLIIPLDHRALQGRICTLAFAPGTPADVVRRVCDEQCPPERLPRSPYHLLDDRSQPFVTFPLARAAGDVVIDFLQSASEPAPMLEQAPDPDQVVLLQHSCRISGATVAFTPAPQLKGTPPAGHDIFCAAEADALGPWPLVETPVGPSGIFEEEEPLSLLSTKHPRTDKANSEAWPPPPVLYGVAQRATAVVHQLSWGQPDDDTAHLFTVFDCQRHHVVLRSEGAVQVQHYVQRAVESAPQPVRAVQFLMEPVQGLPLPQIVLTLVTDARDRLAVPWDGRTVGLPLRTVAHFSGEPLAQAAADLQATLPEEPDVALHILTGRFVVLDVAGILQGNFPDDLTELQVLHLEVSGWSALQSVGDPFRLPPSLRGPAGILSMGTTSTTTGMIGPLQRVFRIRILSVGKEVHRDLPMPFAQLDNYLHYLLLELQRLEPNTEGETMIALAKAQPPPEGHIQEILFVAWSPADPNQAFAIYDARPHHDAVTVEATHRIRTVESVLPSQWRQQQGLFTLVNGAPDHLAQRPILNADYLQIGLAAPYTPHTAASEIMDLIPNTEAYGWPFLARRTASDTSFVARARERRRAARVWLAQEGTATIIGPAHAPVRLRIDGGLAPTVEELREAVQRVPEFNRMYLPIALTTDQRPGRSIFTTAMPNSDLRTVLLPLPTSPGHFVVLLLTSRAQDLGYLPLDPQQRVLWPRGRWYHGQIIVTYILPSSVAGPLYHHIRPPPPPERQTLSPSGRVVPRSGTSLAHLSTDEARQASRCNRLRILHPDSAQCPCEEGTLACLEAHSDGLPVEDEPEGALSLLQLSTEWPSARHLAGSGSHAIWPPLPALWPGQGTGKDSGKVTLALDNLLPAPATGLGFGLSPDMLDFFLSEFCPAELPQTLPLVPHLPTDAAAGWSALPAWDGQDAFTDGSFFPGSTVAGWSVVLLGLCRQQPVRIGITAGTCAGDSAYVGELHAIVYARALALSLRPLPVVVGSDCTSALSVAFGMATFACDDLVARAAVGLALISTAFQQPVAPLHVRSHVGCAFNDLADGLAKCAARGLLPAPWQLRPEVFWQGVREGTMDWMWMLAPGYSGGS